METRPGMTAPLRHSDRNEAGSAAAEDRLPAAVRAAVDAARAWAGEDLVALLLSGSHASGEGVWLEVGGRTVTLSDVDLYAVLRTAEACRRGEARAAAGRADASARLRDAGLEAPLEVGFLTPDGLGRMAARPGTIELARHGLAVAGDAGMLARVPRYAPADVPREEASLLLENRGFELLLARPKLDAGDALERARARHAVLKASADLATVLALGVGELPEGTAARIEFASDRLPFLLPTRPLWGIADGASDLGRLWSAARAWRSGGAGVPDAASLAAEWHRATVAWCAVWWTWFGRPDADRWKVALRAGARAPLRRRLRRGLAAGGPGGPLRRVKLALAGTPQHRVNASAAVLLLAAAEGTAPTPAGALHALPVGALSALHALGACTAKDWEAARREVVRAWDELVMRGQRAEDAR